MILWQQILWQAWKRPCAHTTKHSSFISTSAAPIKVLVWLEVGEKKKKRFKWKRRMWKVWEWGTAGQTQRPAVCLENCPDPRHTKEPLQRKLDKSWAPVLSEREREKERGGAFCNRKCEIEFCVTVVDYHSKVFFLYIYFWKKSHDQGWIYLIKNTVKTVILWNIIAI